MTIISAIDAGASEKEKKMMLFKSTMCTSFFYFFCVSSLLGISIFANLNRIPDLLRLKNVESVQAVVISSFARSDGNSVAINQLAVVFRQD